jgi:hypothetical protein
VDWASFSATFFKRILSHCKGFNQYTRIERVLTRISGSGASKGGRCETEMSSSELSPSLTSILTDSTADFFRERLPAKLSTAGKRASASNQ